MSINEIIEKQEGTEKWIGRLPWDACVIEKWHQVIRWTIKTNNGFLGWLTVKDNSHREVFEHGISKNCIDAVSLGFIRYIDVLQDP